MHRGFGNIPYNMFIIWIIPITLIVIISIAVYMIANSKKRNNKTASNSALEILSERFAKGEIDEEEYKYKKKILKD